jgi:glycosyltransferase involved in cell wall biosynthesis
MKNDKQRSPLSLKDSAGSRSIRSDRPHILAILPGIIPSTSILIIKPLLQLSRSGCIRLQIVLESAAKQNQIEWADVVMFCRNTEPRYRRNLELILQLGIPYIYDLDDNFFELPENTELGAYHRHPDRIAQLREYLECADLVRVYSQPMLECIQPINRNVIKTFGPIDFSRIDATERKTGDQIRLIFSTSSYQNDLLSIILPAVDKILQKHAGKVEAHFWGIKPKGLFGQAHARFHKFIMDYDGFLRSFSRSRFDIGLAPMLNDPFHRSKTNNKFREYGACGIAGVYSNVEVYSAYVRNEETGLLVQNNFDNWYSAISRLIENPDLLKKIKRQSQEFIRQHYSQEQFVSYSWELIKNIAGEKSRRVRTPVCRLNSNQSHGNCAGIISKIFKKIRTWKSWMKVLDKNPVSFFFWLTGRFLFVHWSLLQYKIAYWISCFRSFFPKRLTN